MEWIRFITSNASPPFPPSLTWKGPPLIFWRGTPTLNDSLCWNTYNKKQCDFNWLFSSYLYLATELAIQIVEVSRFASVKCYNNCVWIDFLLAICCEEFTVEEVKLFLKDNIRCKQADITWQERGRARNLHCPREIPTSIQLWLHDFVIPVAELDRIKDLRIDGHRFTGNVHSQTELIAVFIALHGVEQTSDACNSAQQINFTENKSNLLWNSFRTVVANCSHSIIGKHCCLLYDFSRQLSA